MREQIKKQMEQFHMLQKGDRILIGLSGGADSICLTQVLYELAGEYELELGAVCCHHGLRGEEADRDVLFAEEFCRTRNIAFYKEYEVVEKRAREKGLSFEEAGREFRYETFRKIMKKEDYHKLAIAHNADDRAETMLFHLARGTGISGLCTMEPVRDFFDGRLLIRPLLWTKKENIEKWLKERDICWRVDGTNQEDVYTRNRVRHYILPELNKINEHAVEHMGETAHQLNEICDYLKEEENRIYEKAVEQKEEGLVVSAKELLKSHLYLKKAVLYRCLCELAEGKKDITSTHVKILLDLLEGETGREVYFIKGIRGWKEYDLLYLSACKECVDEKAKKNSDFLNQMELVMEKYPYTGEGILKNEYTKYFDCDKIMNELCLRFWQDGDYLLLREDGGKKKLNRYFIDCKIPVDERNKIPLLADGNHILWIVGHRISAYYKVTEDTKNILKVSVTKQTE